MRRRRHRGRGGGQPVSPVWPVAVGNDRKVWATGYTDCADSFASVDAYGRTFGGMFDVFVPELAADGASRVWGTCIGSMSGEAVRAMLCDAHGPMILGLSAWSVDRRPGDGRRSPEETVAVVLSAPRAPQEGSWHVGQH